MIALGAGLPTPPIRWPQVSRVVDLRFISIVGVFTFGTKTLIGETFVRA
jgi:hypothetical protein